MIKKLTRAGNSVALVLDKPLLEQLGLEERSIQVYRK
jgi:antitoxin component of MazEF toxin-antitoxin module